MAEHEGEGRQHGFRRRGRDISRLEGFSDCVFAVALTLLVVSLEVPKDYQQFVEALRSLPTFAVSFGILAWIWVSQYRFFRRYGLEDGRTLGLTLALLFVVCFYVYPLKFLYTAAFGNTSLAGTAGTVVFTVYGVGFTAVFTVLALMYLHAHASRQALGLDDREVTETLAAVAEYATIAGIGVVSIALALVPFPGHTIAAGLVYFLIGVVSTISGVYRGRRARRRR